ncbi:TPA: hypothetical protein HA239_04205 [Candidatus Woesearchaeota archaeon]|nr:hypothetical protein QT06_C0001G0740 [archaeon GW2011_AR15]MBS3103476.1 hypothetical protein [Candidatus Woesearchaeota archaeon]HIH41594.1 hypothetical protein [Candidatus Woesearchaeota archaeon]
MPTYTKEEKKLLEALRKEKLEMSEFRLVLDAYAAYRIIYDSNPSGTDYYLEEMIGRIEAKFNFGPLQRSLLKDFVSQAHLVYSAEKKIWSPERNGQPMSEELSNLLLMNLGTRGNIAGKLYKSYSVGIYV